jgi:GTP1/Obg family GTP-binding protein
MLLPFLDHDLAAFLFSLPYEATGEQGFHDRVIEKAYPNYAHIPYSDSLTVTMGKHSWQRRIKTMREGLSMVKKLRKNNQAVLKELQAQLAVMRDNKQRVMNSYRQYMQCFEWMQEADFAQHYIDVISQMEPTIHDSQTSSL